nr:capsid [Hebeloma mesophaeum partitivirus 2]
MSFLLSKFKRKGTRADFSQPKSSLPPARDEPTVIESSTTTAEEIKKKEAVDKDVDKHVDRDPKADETDVIPAPSSRKGKVKDNIVSARGATSSTVAPSAMFAAFWSGLQNYRLQPLTFSTVAWFVPNAMPLIALLEIAVPLVARSNWIMKNETTFMPYAVQVALCYIYYICILRAREAAGQLTGRESSALTRFRKMVKEEKVIIPGPFVPYFYNIVATQLEDRKYNWVVPSYGDLSHFTNFTEASHADVAALNYMRPMIPGMLAQLATIGTMDAATLTGRIDEDRIFTSIDLDRAANTHVFGANRDFHTAGNLSSIHHFMLSAGMTTPIQFWNENWTDAARHLRNSEFYGIPAPTATDAAMTTGIDIVSIQGRTLPNGVANAKMTKDCTNIDSFLFLEKDKNANWSAYIFEQLAVFAKHFDGNKNLSEMPTVGGMETSVLCQMRTPTAHGTPALYLYPNNDLNVATRANVKWYDNRFKQLTGYFRSTRADVTQEEQYQALAFAPNALPPIQGLDAEDPRKKFRSGNYFDHMNGATDRMDLMQIGESSNAIPGQVNLYQGWDIDVVRPAFRPRPTDA